MEGVKNISWLLGDSGLLTALVSLGDCGLLTALVSPVPSKFPIGARKFLLWLSGVSWAISIHTVGWRDREQLGCWYSSLTEDLAVSTPPLTVPSLASLLSSNKTLKLFHTSQTRKSFQGSARFLDLFLSCIFCVLEVAHLDIFPIAVVFLNMHPAIYAKPMEGKHVILLIMC